MRASLHRLRRAGGAAALLLVGLSGSGCGDTEPPGSATGTTTSVTTSSGGGAGGTGGIAGAGGMGGAGGAVAGVGGSGGGESGPPIGQVVPDFSLTDVNPASPTGGQPVSPRDYLMRVSAWYFGHAT